MEVLNTPWQINCIPQFLIIKGALLTYQDHYGQYYSACQNICTISTGSLQELYSFPQKWSWWYHQGYLSLSLEIWILNGKPALQKGKSWEARSCIWLHYENCYSQYFWILTCTRHLGSIYICLFSSSSFSFPLKVILVNSPNLKQYQKPQRCRWEMMRDR